MKAFTLAVVVLVGCGIGCGKESGGASAASQQKGVKAGDVVVGYVTDPKDSGTCTALTAPAAEKATWDAAKIASLAKTLDVTVVPSCPMGNVVGTCSAMGMLTNYSSPKYDKDSAKKDCATNRGAWIE